MNKSQIKRYRALIKITQLTELPLIILGFGWLILLIVELIWQLTPLLRDIVLVIWIIFIIDFLLKFILSPEKWKYLSKNVITLISLVVPALRVFRIFASLRLLRSLRVIRSLNLVRIIGTLNRGVRVLGKTLERRAFGYIFLLTLIICFVGAAAMFAFERETGAFANFGEALWWTAMLITTIASEYWPQTPEGRAICFLLSVYSLGVLGYFTATLASFFIGQDATNKDAEIASAKQIKELAKEMKIITDLLRNSNSGINN